MCHGPLFLIEPVNPVLPREGRWLTGEASARASEETGVQFDPTLTLQATQVPLNEAPQENAWWRSNNLTMRGGMGMISGLVKAGVKAGIIWSNASWSNTKPTHNPTTVPAWKEMQNSLMTMYKRGSNPGDHCFLVPRLISGLTGWARAHLRTADLNLGPPEDKKWAFVDHRKREWHSRSTSTRSNVREVSP